MFEVIAEVREVFKCLGIQLDHNCLSVVDRTTTVKKEHFDDDDRSWEDPLEEKYDSIDDEFASNMPLTIDLGEASVKNIDASIHEVHEGQSLLPMVG